MSIKMVSGFTFRHLSRMFCYDLLPNALEILRPFDGYTATHIQECMRQGQEHDRVAHADKGHPVLFFQVQPAPDLPGNGDLTAPSNFGNNHRIILPDTEIYIICLINFNLTDKIPECQA